MSPGVYSGARSGLRTRIAEPISARARARRRELFRRLVAPEPGERLVDVGCGPAGAGPAAFEPELEVTGVDAAHRPDWSASGHRFVQADARVLPFGDREFDIAYSNSVIEHLEPADRPRFAREVRRVAKRWFVQTPARGFPVEPHVLLPFFQHLPLGARRRLWRFGASHDEFQDIRLLDAHELRALFPGSVIVRERFMGITKSLIAAGPSGEIRGSKLKVNDPGSNVSERSGAPDRERRAHS